MGRTSTSNSLNGMYDTMILYDLKKKILQVDLPGF